MLQSELIDIEKFNKTLWLARVRNAVEQNGLADIQGTILPVYVLSFHLSHKKRLSNLFYQLPSFRQQENSSI